MNIEDREHLHNFCSPSVRDLSQLKEHDPVTTTFLENTLEVIFVLPTPQVHHGASSNGEWQADSLFN